VSLQKKKKRERSGWKTEEMKYRRWGGGGSKHLERIVETGNMEEGTE